MANTTFDAAWERVRDGKTTVVLGSTGPGRPHPPDLTVVRADCDATGVPFSAIREALHEAEALGGEGAPRFEEQAERVWSGLRRRILGEAAEPTQAGDLVMAMNRLRGDRARPVLLLTAVDRADEATQRTLLAIVARRDWLRVPALLVFRTHDPGGMSRRIVDRLRSSYGEGGILEHGKLPSKAPTFDPAALTIETRRVVRAAAVLGPSFEASDLAALLEEDRQRILESLQDAADGGVPVEDRGDGRFQLTDEAVALLKKGLLPSLASAWHGRLANLFASQVEALSSHEHPIPTPPMPSPPTAAEAVTVFGSDQGPASLRLLPYTPDDDESTPPAERPATSIVRADAASGLQKTRAKVTQDARAAQHAEAAGDYDTAARHFLAAANAALQLGAHEEAHLLVHRAMGLVESRPESPEQRTLMIETLLTHGRLQWQAALPGTDFTLHGALDSLESAQRLLKADDREELYAEVAQLIAGVCYDIGEPRALDRALEELTRASDLLLQADRSLGAARLLNDQAAVWVRIGDPVRANHLLKEAQEIFSKLAPGNDSARKDLAETDHMLARLVLHVKSQPGHEQDAIDGAVRHAEQSARFHEDEGDDRSLARVRETLGRLYHRAERLDDAAEALLGAVEIQQRVGDVIGLASSTEALSEVLSDSGDLPRALELLGESVALNLEKGSPRGLAMNRTALQKLEARLESPRDRLAFAFRKLDDQLTAAEDEIGRVG